MNRYLLFLIAIAAAARLIPHPLNIAPIGALGLFSGAYINDKRAYLIPIAALVIGDAFIGFYAGVVMVSVYAGFAAAGLIGRALLANKRTMPRIALAIVANAAMFYLISNIGMWWWAYPHTANALIQCYVDGLPFLARSFAGDIFYTALLFGTYELTQKGSEALFFNQKGTE